MLISCLRLAWKADILHAHWGINGAIAGLVGLLMRRPVVTSLRGSDVRGLEQKRLKRWLLWLCCATNKRGVCVGKGIQHQMAMAFPRWSSKLVTIPNGVGEDFFQVGAKQRPASSVLRITSIGNLTRQKGMHIVLEAAARVRQCASIRMSIIGDGPEKNALQHQCFCLGLSGIVKIHGHIPHSEISENLFNTDIFVLASFSEGRPNVLLEAMAAGVPVIASDIDGVRELIAHGKTGLLFEPGRPEQLAEQIASLSRNQRRRTEIGRAGRASLLQCGLSWDNAATSYAAVYKEVLQCAE